MVKVKEDLTGKIFGRLTVVKQVEDYILPCGKHHARWLCRCSCIDQKEVVVWGASLRRGDTTSCGCLGRENQIQSCKKYNEYRIDENIVIGLTTSIIGFVRAVKAKKAAKRIADEIGKPIQEVFDFE